MSQKLGTILGTIFGTVLNRGPEARANVLRARSPPNQETVTVTVTVGIKSEYPLGAFVFGSAGRPHDGAGA